jgi:hypothetical protein
MRLIDAGPAHGRDDAAMDTLRGPRRLTLDVQFDADTISGSIDAGASGSHRFSGWLEFGQAIETAYKEAPALPSAAEDAT